jgi:hypothetical protein
MICSTKHTKEVTMKTTAFRCALGAAAMTMLVQASPANAFIFGSILASGHETCADGWAAWEIALDPPAYALWKATCFDTSGTGSDENLTTSKLKKPPYQSDPKHGFGDTIPVTLPPDRHPNPRPGRDTGIAVKSGPLPAIPPVVGFRPR